MRCLYCGKELALLKRWTGGGEFCSDAHRQRYQEEYNQLALNRLLQAKPPAKPEAQPAAETKPAAPAKPVVGSQPAQQPQMMTAPPPAYREISAPAAVEVRNAEAKHAEVKKPETVREIPAPVAAPVFTEVATEVVAEVVHEEPEVTAPAEAAGFFVEMPVAVLAEVAPMSRPDSEFLDAVAAALPNHVFEPIASRRDTYQLETAGLLTFQPSNRASNYSANGSRERRLEVRDFVRSAPLVEINLSPAGETGLETSSEAMDILIFPQPPQGSAVLWQEPPVRFAAASTELGELARLSFGTTGFSGGEEPGETAVAVEEPPAMEVLRELQIEAHFEPAVEIAPIPEPEPEPEPPVIEEVVQPVVEEVPEPVVAQAPPIPALVTKPLPLSLHATVPGKGKTVQVFASVPNAVQVQIPRPASLPLRPSMTFGPAPVPTKNDVKAEVKPVAKTEVKAEVKTDVKPEVKAEIKPEIKIDPKKPVVTPAPVRPDPRLVTAKLRASMPEVPPSPQVKPAVEIREEKKPAAKVPIPEPLKQVARKEIPTVSKAPLKPDAKQDKKPEAKENVNLKEEIKPVKVAEPLQAPLAAPYSSSSDLGLPRLSMQQSSPGFLGRLPMLAKVGIVVVLLAGIGCLIAFSSKSGGAAVTGGGPGTVVAGSALPVGEAGWITDWGADPGVRRTRQISILRSSQTLTDYRIEMQGQIESKAIGWIFRAADSKNFYVTKLEIMKPGLEPTVALVRFAVINGEEQAHAQLPLPMKVRRDTMYKIRFDAVGSHFTTYVLDVKIDDWNDDHVKTGGVGLYRERGEDATLKGGMNVVPLIIRK